MKPCLPASRIPAQQSLLYVEWDSNPSPQRFLSESPPAQPPTQTQGLCSVPEFTAARANVRDSCSRRAVSGEKKVIEVLAAGLDHLLTRIRAKNSLALTTRILSFPLRRLLFGPRILLWMFVALMCTCTTQMTDVVRNEISDHDFEGAQL